MSNEFFTKTGNPQANSAGSSSLIRAEIALVEAGFDKLPTLTGNGGEIIAVNAGATALEAVTTTGTGSAVRATSPTLVTPALGTPSALVGTNITGTAAGLTAGNVTTNANLTGHITSVGNAAVLGSFTSAQLATALTDETGSGAAVFANSPTLVTPALGTPSSGVVTNLTGTASININGTVGATTPAAGTFTTLTSTGNATLGDAEASDTHAIKGATTLLANSASAALTVTQTGAGNAFVVEDSTSPDATPFTVSASGEVGIGAAPVGSQKLQVSSDAQLGYVGISSTAAPIYLRRVAGTVASPTVVSSGNLIGLLSFQGYDGASNIEAASILASVDGTPGTNDMPGRLVFSTTADGASSPTERMRIDSAGSVGIGATPSAGRSFAVSKTMTGSTLVIGVRSDGVVQSDATSIAHYFRSVASTAAAAFTLPDLYHYSTAQTTIGATSTVTNQMGFTAESSLTGATNNFGFYSNIAAAANRWNFYAAGTADNYFAGRVAVGSSNSAVGIHNGWAMASGGTSNYGFALNSQAGAGTTIEAVGYSSYIGATAGLSFSLLAHFRADQAPLNASTVTSQRGFAVSSALISAANNYGFYSEIASAANRWNFFSQGTANNAYAGNSSFGKVTAPTTAVDTTSLATNLVTNAAGTYTVLTTDHTIIQTTAASTYTLPAAASFPGRRLHLVTQFAGAVISASSNVVPLAGGAAGTAILAATAGKFAMLQSNGTNWLIVAAN